MMAFKKTGVTIVFVSYSMLDIERICDRVAWIENHSIKMMGEPGVVSAEYAGPR